MEKELEELRRQLAAAHRKQAQQKEFARSIQLEAAQLLPAVTGSEMMTAATSHDSMAATSMGMVHGFPTGRTTTGFTGLIGSHDGLPLPPAGGHVDRYLSSQQAVTGLMDLRGGVGERGRRGSRPEAHRSIDLVELTKEQEGELFKE